MIGRDRGYSTSGRSSTRDWSTMRTATDYKQVVVNLCESAKNFLVKILNQILLIFTQISDEQKIMFGIAVLGLIFYFLIYSGVGKREGRYYSDGRYQDRTDSYRTETTGRKRNYNDDASFSNPINNGNRNYGFQNNYHSNYESHGSYGFDGMSWMVWGGILGGAYFLPPYFPDLLGHEYSKPFFGMSMFTFSMILNMFSNSMRGSRGGMRGMGNVFNRRRY